MIKIVVRKENIKKYLFPNTFRRGVKKRIFFPNTFRPGVKKPGYFTVRLTVSVYRPPPYGQLFVNFFLMCFYLRL